MGNKIFYMSILIVYVVDKIFIQQHIDHFTGAAAVRRSVKCKYTKFFLDQGLIKWSKLITLDSKP